MNIFSKKLLFSARRKYTLTVVTSPGNAACVMTINGISYTTKFIKVEEGTYITVTVSYSGTTTKTYSLTLEKNTTLTFNRTYSTSTIFNNNLVKTGSPNLNTTTGIASGFSKTDYLNFPSNINASYTDKPFELKTKLIPGANMGNTNIIRFSYDGSYPYGPLLQLYNKKVRGYLGTSTSAAGISLLPDLVLDANTTYYIKFSWNVEAANQMYIGVSTNNYSWTYKTYNATHWFTHNNSQATICKQAGGDQFLGSIDLKNTEINLNGASFWNGKITSYTYYFNVQKTQQQ